MGFAPDSNFTMCPAAPAGPFPLEQFSTGTANGHDLVFATDIGSPLTSGWVRKSFYRLLDDKTITRIPLHGLRHTMATLMLAAGEHPKVVSERLGHSNPSFTLTVYSHVLPGMHEDASRRLEAALRSPGSQAVAQAATDGRRPRGRSFASVKAPLRSPQP